MSDQVGPQDPADKVREAIKELRHGYAVGRRLLSEFGARAESGKHQMEEEAQKYGYTADAARKLRQFAQQYTEDDLAELVALCRKYHRAFGLSLIYRLVSINNKTRRKALQREAIINHWGKSRLLRELKHRLPRGHTRGRQPNLPESIAEALVEIGEAKSRFARLLMHCAKLAADNGGDKKSVKHLRDLCESLLEVFGASNPGGPEAGSTDRGERTQKTQTDRRSRKRGTGASHGLFEGENLL